MANYIKYLQDGASILAQDNTRVQTRGEFQPIEYQNKEIVDAARRLNMTVEDYLKMMQNPWNWGFNGIIYEDQGSDALNYHKAVSTGDPQTNAMVQATRDYGEQKARENAGKAAEAILGLTMPSSYINAGLTLNDKKPLSAEGAFAIDLITPAAIGAGVKGFKLGAQTAKKAVPRLMNAVKEFNFLNPETLLMMPGQDKFEAIVSDATKKALNKYEGGEFTKRLRNVFTNLSEEQANKFSKWMADRIRNSKIIWDLSDEKIAMGFRAQAELDNNTGQAIIHLSKNVPDFNVYDVFHELEHGASMFIDPKIDPTLLQAAYNKFWINKENAQILNDIVQHNYDLLNKMKINPKLDITKNDWEDMSNFLKEIGYDNPDDQLDFLLLSLPNKDAMETYISANMKPGAVNYYYNIGQEARSHISSAQQYAKDNKIKWDRVLRFPGRLSKEHRTNLNMISPYLYLFDDPSVKLLTGPKGVLGLTAPLAIPALMDNESETVKQEKQGGKLNYLDY